MLMFFVDIFYFRKVVSLRVASSITRLHHLPHPSCCFTIDQVCMKSIPGGKFEIATGS